jgi:hypothetical protein
MSAKVPPGAWYAMQLVMVVIIVMLVVRLLACRRQPNLAHIKSTLDAQGWDLYASDGCSWCHKQVEALGGGYSRLKWCGAANSCPADITGFPTWRNARTGETMSGFHTLAALDKMTKKLPH